jgi:hypothetical protein
LDTRAKERFGGWRRLLAAQLAAGGRGAQIAVLTLARTFRWNELGPLDRVVIVILWIAVPGGGGAIDLTVWRYWRARVDSTRRERAVRSRNSRSIYCGLEGAAEVGAGASLNGFGGL